MLVNTQPPKEFLLKDEAFAEQSEVRIIINSTSSKYLEYMKEHNNTISIGSLADITDIYDYYFDDMEIERIGNKRAMISLPQSKAYQIQDLNYLVLEDLLFSILGGTVELTGTSCNDSWRNKLKPIIDLFYTKFGIVLDVDDNKNVSMHNVPDELLRQSREKYKHLYKQKQFESDIENLLNKGDYLKAHEKCLDASQDNKLYGAVCFHLGIIYKAQHQYQNAIDSFKKSYSYDYKRIESLDGIASIYYLQSEFAKAIDEYKRIQEEKGYDSKIWGNIGLCYFHLKQYDRAIECFDEGIIINEHDAFLYYNKGVVYYSMGQYLKAKGYMEKAIALDPGNEIYRMEYEKCFGHMPDSVDPLQTK